MWERWVGSVGLILAVLTAMPAQEAKSDRDKVQGKWEVVEIVTDGDKAPVKDATVVIDKDKLTLKLPNENPDTLEFSFKLDSAKKPKEIELTPLNGEFKGKVAPGIYLLEGEMLKICAPSDPTKNLARPKEFSAPDKSGMALLVLKRVKA